MFGKRKKNKHVPSGQSRHLARDVAFTLRVIGEKSVPFVTSPERRGEAGRGSNGWMVLVIFCFDFKGGRVTDETAVATRFE